MKALPDPKQRTSGVAMLERLLTDLDKAIDLAIQDPCSFYESPLLATIEKSCSEMLLLIEQKGVTGMEALVWRVRERAGRLQQLLNTAAHFYSQCFSAAADGQPFIVWSASGFEYGVHGEWGTMLRVHHLTVDC